MAKKTVDPAAKAKKQKIILAAGVVLLLGVAALQGPKLLSHGSQPAAVPAPEASATAGSPAPVAAVATVTPAATVTRERTVAVVAGVPFTAGPAARPATSQLASFTLFEAKDPFVPEVNDGSSAGQPATGAAQSTTQSTSAGNPPADASAGATATPGASASSGAGSTPAAAPQPIVYATINLGGKPQQVKVKDQFPAKSPLFVLRSLKKKSGKIGVAGGSFDGGQAVTLEFGKTVTLVDTATGVRYELKLVYTGSAPEVIEGFTTDQSKTGSTAGSSSTTTTSPATTTAK